MYNDQSTIAGGGQHVLKTSGTDSRSKKFSLVAKLAQCWIGPYKNLFVGPETAIDGKMSVEFYCCWRLERTSLVEKSTPECRCIVVRGVLIRIKEQNHLIFFHGR